MTGSPEPRPHAIEAAAVLEARRFLLIDERVQMALEMAGLDPTALRFGPHPERITHWTLIYDPSRER